MLTSFGLHLELKMTKVYSRAIQLQIIFGPFEIQ